MSESDGYYIDPSATPNPQPRQHVSARVPPHVANGSFCTAFLVLTGGNEFVLDFVQNLGQRPQIAARVVLPHAVLPQFVDALQKALDNYTSRFGAPAELPGNPRNQRQPTAKEIYEDVKIDDQTLAGAYANAVMIAHGPSEFRFDFVINALPHPAVSSRVFLTAQRVPRLLKTLTQTAEQFQQRLRKQQQQRDEKPDDDGGEQA